MTPTEETPSQYPQGIGTDFEDDDEDMEDHNNFVLASLIELLVAKGVFTQEEFDRKMEELEEREEQEENIYESRE